MQRQYFFTSMALLILIFKNRYYFFFKGESQYIDQELLFKNQTIVKSHQKLQEFLLFLMILKLQLLHWRLPPDTGQCSAKNRAMFYKSCFLTDTFVLHEVKKEFGKHRPFAMVFFINILIDNLLMQFFIFKTVRCVWVKRFYTTTLLGFFALLGTSSPLKTFYVIT